MLEILERAPKQFSAVILVDSKNYTWLTDPEKKFKPIFVLQGMKQIYLITFYKRILTEQPKEI